MLRPDTYNLRSQIEEIRRSASPSEQVDREAIERRLLGLLGKNSNPESRGLIYAAIANVYSGDLAHHAEDTVRYAREALTNQLGIMDECDMYLCLGKSAEARVRHGPSPDAADRENLVVPFIQGLAVVLDHLRINKSLPPPPVGKYDVEPNDPQYEEVVRQHAKQTAIRDDVLQQNRLLAYRDDFSRRVLELYGRSLIKELAFTHVVREAVGNAGRAEKVLLHLDDVADKQGKSR